MAPAGRRPLRPRITMPGSPTLRPGTLATVPGMRRAAPRVRDTGRDQGPVRWAAHMPGRRGDGLSRRFRHTELLGVREELRAQRPHVRVGPLLEPAVAHVHGL